MTSCPETHIPFAISPDMSQTSWYVQATTDSSLASVDRSLFLRPGNASSTATNNPRTQKQPLEDFNGNVDGHAPVPDLSSSALTVSSSSSSFTIPPNKGGKRYNMDEVFQVWYDKKDDILNTYTELPVLQYERYKLQKPSQIYHLDLQLVSSGKTVPQTADPVNGLHESFAQLSTNGVPETFAPAANAFEAPKAVTEGPPPGLAPLAEFERSQQPVLLSPDRIEWHYIDPSGNEQGPFNGNMMQEWLTDGYLNLDLRIRRKEETHFQTLKDLCDRVQNYAQPFKVPLPDLTAPVARPFHEEKVPSVHQQPLFNQPQSNFPFLSNGPLGAGGMRLNTSVNSGLFGNDWQQDPFSGGLNSATGSFPTSATQFGVGQPMVNPLTMPLLLQQQIHQQQPVLLRNNSGWGLDAPNGAFINGNPAPPANTVPVIQPTPLSPWLSGVQSLSRVSSPFVPTSTLPNEIIPETSHDDHVLEKLHSSVVTGILSDGDEDHGLYPTSKQFSDEAPASVKEQSSAPAPEPEHAPVSAPAFASRTSAFNDYSSDNAAKEKAAPAVFPQSHAVAVEPNYSSVAKAAAAAQVATLDPEFDDPKPPVVETLRPSVPSQEKLAPWAAAAAVEAKPALTLKEIQEIEAEKMEKQKQLQAELRREQVLAAAAALEAEEKAVDSEKVTLPKTTGWATTTQPTNVTKTLAEIQKEEAEAAAKAKAARSAASALNSTPSAHGSLDGSFASAISTSVPKSDFAWSTVSSKKPPVKKTSVAMGGLPSVGTPQLLRSVSANRPISYSVNSLGLKEDFLVWARASMTNMYPSVSKDDLLDIFLTLPVSGPDSALLIAETIYSSSATMDGRRFSQEFLKKRKTVEQQIGTSDDVPWSAAIISSADKVQTVDEDGWSTNVKSKKKGRKN